MGMEKRLATIWGAIVGGTAISAAAGAFAGDTNTLVGSPIVLAQAGSTGGTIGKQGKSASGDEEQSNVGHSGRAPRRDSPERVPRPTSASRSTISLTGQWLWKTICGATRGEGGFDLVQSATNEFTGKFTISPHFGTITDGRLEGNRVSFTRNYGLTQEWSGVVSRAGSSYHLAGSFTDPFWSGCRFEASKN